MPENPIPPLNLDEPANTPKLVLSDPPSLTPTPVVVPDPISPPLPSEPLPSIQSTVQSPAIATRKFPFLLTVVLLILSVAAAIGIYLLVQVRKMALDNITPSPTPVAISTPSPDPTADWQSYSNSKYSYSLRVPNHLTHLNRGPSNQKKIDDNDWYFAKTDLSELDDTHKPIAKSGAIFLEIAVYKDAAQENYNLHCAGKLLSFNQQEPIISTESLVGEVDEYIQSSGLAFHSTAPKAQYWDSKTCFMKDGIDYEIYYQNYESSEPDPVFAQILSTFEFGKTGSTSNPLYVCPKTEWVDCMPSPDAGVKLECTPEFLTWARSTCPGFKGGAL